jgi:FAD/FMN-containing dehydrogenase
MINELFRLAETQLIQKFGKGIIKDLLPYQMSEPRGHFRNYAHKVIEPKNTNEVSQILRILNDLKVKVIPYCGGTGLVGGQMAPTADYYLLSLEKMARIRDISETDGTLTVEAGMILSNVQCEAKKINRFFPLSLASEGTCQIGGNLATNAGGINVIKFGNARNLCLGIEAVLADGTIYNGLSGLIKDNTGYDLRNLLIGSEGTLGVITAATLKTFPLPEETIVSMLKIKNPSDAVILLRALEKVLGDQLQAFELISHIGLEFLKQGGFKYKDPFADSGEWMVLVEVAGPRSIGLRPVFEDSLHDLMKKNLLHDAVISNSASQAEELWYIRESMPEANRLIGAICSSDISVPISNIPDFISMASKGIKKVSNKLRVNCFGHIGDGNIHFNVFPPLDCSKKDFQSLKEDVTDLIHETAVKLEGSFSAEHGVGRLKTEDLKKYGDSGKLKIMWALKNALDPNFILNPGALLTKL